MSAPTVLTFGCRLNAFESEVIRERAGGRLDGTIVVNTCAVTAEAERQARQAIRRARRENPRARIIVTGCAAQLDPARFAAMPEVDRVVGNLEKLDPDRLLGIGASAEAKIQVADIMTVRTTAGHLIQGFDGRTRAFVEVQQGCDHRCTFCIIPFARGANRGVPVDSIIGHVRALVGAGFAEVVLTGVDIASYGRDLAGQPTLGDMVSRVLASVPELKRLRLSTLDPAVMDEALFRALADEPRLMPHLHLSLQAFDDLILKRMRRRHSQAAAAAFVARARAARPDLVFGADLIAGFPTETDAMFENARRGIEELGLTYLHVFPYSARPGTPAERMPQVAKAVRLQRAAALRALGDRLRDRFLRSRVGRSAEVLVEKNRSGLSEHYAAVRLDHDAPLGRIAKVRVAGVADGALYGTRSP
ncbi:MAG: tRNA (N(6)-L-threonylcarbamoyladenosine(37)-C(2))-methylthiotransferase MtaB [Rhodospirillales bacterium]|nr:tRNA (N(6)-L-threonylcarbamoyladenosine(37)-C(2))-methylthiotransferase MtaB [Rhodospirillales bacterium]